MDIKYFDMTGRYDYYISANGGLTFKQTWGQKMVVFGATFEKTTGPAAATNAAPADVAVNPIAVPAEIERE